MKSQTESLEHASVRQYCKAVRMPTVGANFVSLAEQAVKENHSHIRSEEHTSELQSLPTRRSSDLESGARQRAAVLQSRADADGGSQLRFLGGASREGEP